MNKIILVLGISLFLQACAGQSSRNRNSEIFSRMTIINEDGVNITEYCGLNVDRNRIFVQGASIGENTVKQITCMPGQYLYSIKSGPMTVNVPAENAAVYFGDIIIKLTAYGYDVIIEDHQANAAVFYRGAKPVKKSLLNVGNTQKGWTKASLDNVASVEY